MVPTCQGVTDSLFVYVTLGHRAAGNQQGVQHWLLKTIQSKGRDEGSRELPSSSQGMLRAQLHAAADQPRLQPGPLRQPALLLLCVYQSLPPTQHRHIRAEPQRFPGSFPLLLWHIPSSGNSRILTPHSQFSNFCVAVTTSAPKKGR